MMIGLVPQELSVDMFETVMATVRFSRRLFGRSGHDAYLEQLLKDLSLWDKRDAKIMELSGGMKRRVLIAKALSHEPDILFLDEPTAGVDVNLRRDMWKLIGKLRERGVTIILTTHYIEEAEEMADRVGVINGGKLLLVEEKAALMKKLGKREMDIALVEPMDAVPGDLDDWHLTLDERRPHPALRVRRAGRAHRHPVAAAQARRPRHRLQGPRDVEIEPRGHLRRPGREEGGGVRHEHARRLGDLSLRDGARAAHPVAEPGHARSSPPACISSCSAARSAAGCSRSTGSATAASSCPG